MWHRRLLLRTRGLRVNHWELRKGDSVEEFQYISKRNWKIMLRLLKKNDYGLLWLKISGALLKSAVDTFVRYLYAREKSSRVYRHEGIDYFELLESDIAKYKKLGKVLVTGDFNARTRTISDFIIHERYIDAEPDDSIQYNDIPVRFNRDRVFVAYGVY